MHHPAWPMRHSVRTQSLLDILIVAVRVLVEVRGLHVVGRWNDCKVRDVRDCACRSWWWGVSGGRSIGKTHRVSLSLNAPSRR